MALKAGYKGIKEVGPGLDYDNTTGLLKLDGESSLKLDNLEDVTIDTPLGGDVLQYDSSNEEWANETPDTEPIEDSPQLITSGAVYAGLKTEDDKISAIWSSNARTGVHNLLGAYIGKGWNASGALTDSAYAISSLKIKVNAGDKFKLSKNASAVSDFLNTNDNLMVREFDSTDTYLSSTKTLAYNAGSAEYTVPSGISYIAFTQYYNEGTFTKELQAQYEVLVRYGADTDTTYAPYAMTNGELTEKVQGIIDAANNAADFAAFKTAIGNL